MAGEIVFSNAGLLNRAQSLRTYLTSNTSLRLFTNAGPPLPSWTLASFSEAGFNGYARVNMATAWGDVFKVKDGYYQFRSSEIVFSAIAGADQIVRGWFLVTSGAVQASAKLPVPIQMLPGKSLTVRVTLDEISTSLLSVK